MLAPKHTMLADSLVQPLFEGPLDIVADVHGEIDALDSVLDQLGYRADGSHPQRRRLVFLGDLVDRGPDSPAVLRRVGDLLRRGMAQCLLGNHELNILLERKKDDNVWFFGHERSPQAGQRGPQAPADKRIRQEALDLFRQLPLALERVGLRIVHACWHPVMIELVRRETDVCGLYRHFKQAIKEALAEQGQTDEVLIELAEQNENPVKVLTSGPEEPAPARYFLQGKWRLLQRARWWESYGDASWCVVGHYARRALADANGLPRDHLIGESDLTSKRRYGPLAGSRVLCIDYSAGYRWVERLNPSRSGPWITRLAALRWPEKTLLFDDGTTETIVQPGEPGALATGGSGR
jgi:hypothetical protein